MEVRSGTPILISFKVKDNRLILLYKGLKGKARISTDNLIPKTRRGRNQHPLAFLNLNLNSLLVKRQIDNPSPGTVTGGN